MSYVPEPEDSTLLKTALNIFRKFDHQPEAMKLAIQLNDIDLIKDIFISCTGRYSKIKIITPAYRLSGRDGQENICLVDIAYRLSAAKHMQIDQSWIFSCRT